MHKNIKRTENFNSRKIREQDSQTQMNQFKINSPNSKEIWRIRFPIKSGAIPKESMKRRKNSRDLSSRIWIGNRKILRAAH